LAYEEDPLHIVPRAEKEGWLKILNPHWTSAKVDTAQLGQLLKTRQQMNELGYAPDPAPTVMYFLTARLVDKDIADIAQQIPRKDLVEAWRDLEDHAKEWAKRLVGKEAATPSRAWKLLSEARPEMILFLSLTARQQAVTQKIKNFFTKWRQVQHKVPLPEMTELPYNAQLPDVSQDWRYDVFMLLLDGKLRSRTETLKYLKPLAPPPSTAATTSAAQAGTSSQGPPLPKRRCCSRGRCACCRVGRWPRKRELRTTAFAGSSQDQSEAHLAQGRSSMTAKGSRGTASSRGRVKTGGEREVKKIKARRSTRKGWFPVFWSLSARAPIVFGGRSGVAISPASRLKSCPCEISGRSDEKTREDLLWTVITLVVLFVIGVSLTIGWRPFIGPRARPLTSRQFERTPQRPGARSVYLHFINRMHRMSFAA